MLGDSPISITLYLLYRLEICGCNVLFLAPFRSVKRYAVGDPQGLFIILLMRSDSVKAVVHDPNKGLHNHNGHVDCIFDHQMNRWLYVVGFDAHVGKD